MKNNKPAADPREEARRALDLWVQRGEAYETIASRVGCSLRSIQKWADGGKMTRLSAKAILAAWES